MEKILLLTDSASDLTPEDEARTGIRVLNLPVSVEGKEYTDRVDLTPDEMYQILNTCKELPTTAHLNMVDFAEAFQKAAEEGYTDIIYMGLNSHGSATYQSALLGKKLFYEHLPQYADVKIHLLDSLSYSYGYGYPLVLAAAVGIRVPPRRNWWTLSRISCATGSSILPCIPCSLPSGRAGSARRQALWGRCSGSSR